MKPEEKCVSLETAKKLKEAGFPEHGTERTWSIGGDKCEKDWTLVNEDDEAVSRTTFIAAPDAQEIGELLPADIPGFYDEAPTYFLVCAKFDDGWMLEYEHAVDSGGYKPRYVSMGYANESEARAACWLYLKENKLI